MCVYRNCCTTVFGKNESGHIYHDLFFCLCPVFQLLIISYRLFISIEKSFCLINCGTIFIHGICFFIFICLFFGYFLIVLYFWRVSWVFTARFFDNWTVTFWSFKYFEELLLFLIQYKMMNIKKIFVDSILTWKYEVVWVYDACSCLFIK